MLVLNGTFGASSEIQPHTWVELTRMDGPMFMNEEDPIFGRILTGKKRSARTCPDGAEPGSRNRGIPESHDNLMEGTAWISGSRFEQSGIRASVQAV